MKRLLNNRTTKCLLPILVSITIFPPGNRLLQRRPDMEEYEHVNSAKPTKVVGTPKSTEEEKEGELS
jgi:hypothetical protein